MSVTDPFAMAPIGQANPNRPFSLAGFNPSPPFQPPPAPKLSPVPPMPPMPTIQGVNPASFGSPMGQQLQGGIGQGLGYMMANKMMDQMLPSGTFGGGGAPTTAPAPPTVSTATSTSSTAQPQLQAMATQVAQQNGLPADFFANLINQESGWNPSAVGGAGERGLTQVLPSNLQSWGIDPNDPNSQLSRSAAILAQYYRDTGSTVGAAISWNAGPGAWQQFKASGYDPSVLPSSTIGYVRSVTGVDLLSGG